MRQHVVAAALACWIGGTVAASTSPSAVVDAFVRAGKADADLAGKVNAIRRRPIIILVPGILGSKLTLQKSGDIWGGDGLSDLEKLKLSAELVSETAASDVRATLSDKDASAPPRSPLGADIVKAADRFRADLCRTTTLCSATYSVAKARSDSPAEQAWAFAGVLGNEERSVPDRASAAAQVGLANAKLGQFRSASHVLGSASVELGRSVELPTISSAGHEQLTDLKSIVDRNLAVTLRESGQCQAAKVQLLSVPGSQTRYASDLATKCLARGTGLYQALNEF